MHATQDSSSHEPPEKRSKKSRTEYNRLLRIRIQKERQALRDIRRILDKLESGS